MGRQEFTQKVIECIRAIPKGRVATYGGIAALAGNARAARQVVRILHTCSQEEHLPWHRVINAQGRISLPRFEGGEEQRARLEAEGVVFDHAERVDFEEFLWLPQAS